MAEETKIENQNENQNQQPEVAKKPAAEDLVLARLLSQERELERLRRHNERLRKAIAERKAESEKPEPAPAPAPAQVRFSYANRLYSILRREHGN